MVGIEGVRETDKGFIRARELGRKTGEMNNSDGARYVGRAGVCGAASCACGTRVTEHPGDAHRIEDTAGGGCATREEKEVGIVRLIHFGGSAKRRLPYIDGDT